VGCWEVSWATTEMRNKNSELAEQSIPDK